LRFGELRRDVTDRQPQSRFAIYYADLNVIETKTSDITTEYILLRQPWKRKYDEPRRITQAGEVWNTAHSGNPIPGDVVGELTEPFCSNEIMQYNAQASPLTKNLETNPEDEHATAKIRASLLSPHLKKEPKLLITWIIRVELIMIAIILGIMSLCWVICRLYCLTNTSLVLQWLTLINEVARHNALKHLPDSARLFSCGAHARIAAETAA
jgi:hypothetical protein